MTTQHYHVLLEWDPEAEAWVTYVPTLNGLSTFGNTREEALANTREAILGYLEATEEVGIYVNDQVEVEPVSEIEDEPAPQQVRILPKGRLWVVEPVEPGEPSSAEVVRQTQN